MVFLEGEQMEEEKIAALAMQITDIVHWAYLESSEKRVEETIEGRSKVIMRALAFVVAKGILVLAFPDREPGPEQADKILSHVTVKTVNFVENLMAKNVAQFRTPD